MRATLQPEQPALRHAALLFGVVLAVCAAMVLSIAWQKGREEDALLSLSGQSRQRIFQGALATLNELCRQPYASAALAERCNEQARFVSLFPECTGPCRATVDANLATPTR